MNLVAYVLKLDHRSKRSGEKENLGKSVFGNWRVLICEWYGILENEFYLINFKKKEIKEKKSDGRKF